MKFTKQDDYHATSDCGRYIINTSGGGPGRRVYMAIAGRRLIGVFHCADNADDKATAYRAAVRACELHRGAVS